MFDAFLLFGFLFFFFSSRRRHTRSLCDWSSDVCSSDLIADASAVADDSFALEFKTGLSKPGRARLLCRMGKRTERSAIDKHAFAGSTRNIGSMPSAQTTMVSSETSKCPAQTLQKRACASSAIATFASK